MPGTDNEIPVLTNEIWGVIVQIAMNDILRVQRNGYPSISDIVKLMLVNRVFHENVAIAVESLQENPLTPWQQNALFSVKLETANYHEIKITHIAIQFNQRLFAALHQLDSYPFYGYRKDGANVDNLCFALAARKLESVSYILANGYRYDQCASPELAQSIIDLCEESKSENPIVQSKAQAILDELFKGVTLQTSLLAKLLFFQSYESSDAGANKQKVVIKEIIPETNYKANIKIDKMMLLNAIDNAGYLAHSMSGMTEQDMRRLLARDDRRESIMEFLVECNAFTSQQHQAKP